MPQIETERLVLRRWDVAGDLDAYAAICGDPEVMRYIGLDRVVSVHAVANDPSGNVLQKIGMHVGHRLSEERADGARLRDRPTRYALIANAAPPARADARIASSTRMHASPSANVGTGTLVGASFPSMPARSASHKRVYGPTSRCV